jgi:photosystem II stability/assembly factor-like uncharacterized protein
MFSIVYCRTGNFLQQSGYNPVVRIAFIILVFCSSVLAQRWSVQTSGLDTNLRGISVKYGSTKGKRDFIVWASGSNGVILRSTNGGRSWKQLNVPGASDFDFRDIEGFDADTAYVMSSGDGDKSRIYKTTDGGNTWTLQYSDKRPGFFLDSLACDSEIHCVALSDPVEGKFLALSTDDGEHWKELPRDKMPAILSGEGAFAASGTAIVLCAHANFYFGTGGGRLARVFHSNDRGRSWTATETPIASGNASSGIFSVTCTGHSVVAVGGDYKEPAGAKRVAVYSKDSGKTWHLAEQQPGGYRSAVVNDSHGNFVAVGPSGTDVSRDAGVHWKSLDVQNFNAASFAETEGWAAGGKGTIARLKTHYK